MKISASGLRLLIPSMVAVLALPAPAGYADDGRDKAWVDAELARTQAILEAATTRAQQAAAAYTAATAALPAAQAALAEATGRVAAAQAVARQAQRDVDAATAAYRSASDAFDAATAVVEQARDRVGELVAAAYRGSGLVAFNTMLTARTPLDFADRLVYLDQVAAEQERELAAVTRARWTVRDRQNEAALARDRTVAANAAAAAALADSQRAQAAARRAADAVQNLIGQREAALAVANAERAAVLARYRELRAESERLAAELRARARRSDAFRASVTASDGFFLMPTRGWKTSDFGMRFDPYYRVWQLHPGIDLAAPNGQAIYAAADGQVVRAGWSGGYGNLTCLSHGTYQGRNLATCYGHQSSILVSTGQRVRRGELIGRIGTTGASTGYHLHFEVRLDGRPVDPLPWLPRCLC